MRPPGHHRLLCSDASCTALQAERPSYSSVQGRLLYCVAKQAASLEQKGRQAIASSCAEVRTAYYVSKPGAGRPSSPRMLLCSEASCTLFQEQPCAHKPGVERPSPCTPQGCPLRWVAKHVATIPHRAGARCCGLAAGYHQLDLQDHVVLPKAQPGGSTARGLHNRGLTPKVFLAGL